MPTLVYNIKEMSWIYFEFRNLFSQQQGSGNVYKQFFNVLFASVKDTDGHLNFTATEKTHSFRTYS